MHVFPPIISKSFKLVKNIKNKLTYHCKRSDPSLSSESKYDIKFFSDIRLQEWVVEDHISRSIYR